MEWQHCLLGVLACDNPVKSISQMSTNCILKQLHRTRMAMNLLVYRSVLVEFCSIPIVVPNNCW